ncbi:MAG: hypothetical protein WB497_04370, partial [Pseudolabrys sp.]
AADNRAAGRLFLHKALRNLHATPAHWCEAVTISYSADLLSLAFHHHSSQAFEWLWFRSFGFALLLCLIERQSRQN